MMRRSTKPITLKNLVSEFTMIEEVVATVRSIVPPDSHSISLCN